MSPGRLATPDGREVDLEVRVHDKRHAARNVVTLDLREVNGEPLPPWTAGAHVDLVLLDGTTRQYSLCGDPTDSTLYRLAVLREEDGRGGSRFIHDNLEVGSTVGVRGPRNHFPLVPSSDYLFIAGGIGITPFLPMIAAAAEAGADWRLYYGGRERAAMAFLDELARYGDRVAVVPENEKGMLDLDAILRAWGGGLVYCCGPESLIEAVEQRCADLPRGSLHVERFNARPIGDPAYDRPFEVVFQQSGLRLTVEPDDSIVELAEDAGLPVSYSCSEGTCGTCETSVLEGLPDHRDAVLTDAEREANDRMMICVSRCRGERLVLDL